MLVDKAVAVTYLQHIGRFEINFVLVSKVTIKALHSLCLNIYSKKKVTYQAVFFLSNFISTNRMICITEQEELPQSGHKINNPKSKLEITRPSCCSVKHIIRFVEIKFERKNTSWLVTFFFEYVRTCFTLVLTIVKVAFVCTTASPFKSLVSPERGKRCPIHVFPALVADILPTPPPRRRRHSVVVVG